MFNDFKDNLQIEKYKKETDSLLRKFPGINQAKRLNRGFTPDIYLQNKAK